MVDQNWDWARVWPQRRRSARGRGAKSDCYCTAKLKANGDIIELTQRGVLGVGREELHLAPKNRVSGYSTVLLRRLKRLLFTRTSV